MKRLSLALLAIGAAASAQTSTPATPPAADPVADAIHGHVAYLASDALRGREAGTADFDRAADYVVSQFAAAGLKPGGDTNTDGHAGYLQKVPLVRYDAVGDGRVGVTARGKSFDLAAGTDYRTSANPAAAKTRVTGRVVFVGQGLDAPTLGRDDYARVDVKGAIVAFVGGAPTDLPSEERAYFGSLAAKLRAAAAHGAVGAVLLAGGTGRTRPRGPGAVIWANPDGTGHSDTPGTPLLASLSDAGAGRLFAAGGLSWKKAGKAKAGRYTPVALPVTMALEGATKFVPLTSSNVIGVVPGSDPAVKNEVVVLSAHLDHVGISEKPDAKGDRINNGALDDAIGIASLIEEARRFRVAAPPRRTIVFLAVTAEEKGLVGSSWFVRHRPKGLEDVVADVNLDMPVLTYPFTDLVAFGGDRSSLGQIIARAAASVGVAMAPDPIPEQAIFVRSDHFRFVEQGVPAVFLWPGLAGVGRAAFDDFMKNRYHQPGDEVDAGILWDQAVRFVDINYRIAREIADAPTRPTWNAGDWFGAHFGRNAAR